MPNSKSNEEVKLDVRFSTTDPESPSVPKGIHHPLSHLKVTNHSSEQLSTKNRRPTGFGGSMTNLHHYGGGLTPNHYSSATLNDHFHVNGNTSSNFLPLHPSIAEKVGPSCNSQSEVSVILQKAAQDKSSYPWWKTLYDGFLAGVFLSFGSFVALTSAGGLDPAFRAAFPSIPKMLVGATFGVALVLIVVVGGELTTGNAMVMMVGVFDHKINVAKMFSNLGKVIVGNFVGCLLSSYLFAYLTEIYNHEPYLSYVISVGESKALQPWYIIILKAIPANALVCLAIVMGVAAKEMSGKVMVLILPVFTFATVGFEHVIANMVFLPLAMMYGAKITIVDYLISFACSALGNAIGGGLLVAGSQSLLYSEHETTASTLEKFVAQKMLEREMAPIS